MKSTHWIASIVVLACAGLFALRASRPPSATAVASPLAGAAKTNAVPSIESASLRAEATTLTYDVDFETRLSTSTDSSHTIIGSLSWTLSPVMAASGSVSYLTSARDVSVTFDQEVGDAARNLGAAIAADLQHPLALELSESGRVSRVGVSPRSNGSGQSVLKSLASALQLVRTGSRPAATWTENETDHWGDFVAQYTRAPTGSVRKQKKYSSVVLPEVLSLDSEKRPEITGEVAFELEEPSTRLPSRVEAKEQLVTGTLRSSSTATLVLKTHGRSAALPASALDGLRWIDLKESIASAPDPARIKARNEKLVGGASFSEVVSELEGLPRSRTNTQERNIALRKLNALFELDPRAIADAKQRLRSGKAGTSKDAILGALSNTSSREARDALSELGKDEALPSELREDAIANLSLRDKPAPETFEDLRKLSDSSDDNVKRSAVLALGTSARSGAQESATQPLARQATQQLVQMAGTASTPEDKILYLNALGNAGGPMAMEAAITALGDSNPEVRAAAASALRFGPAPDADLLIAKLWATDPSPDVRVAATTAATFRPLTPELMNGALTTLRTDPEARVRLAIVGLLKEHLATQPAIRDILLSVSQNDSNPDVKEAAALAVAQAPTLE